MSDIFREIEQDIRRDDALRLWSKFQIPVYVLAALILVGVGAWRYWDYRRQQAAEAQGARYDAALQLAATGKDQQALSALQAIANGPSGYALLARLSSANVQSAKNPTAAIAAYKAVAAESSAPDVIKNLARFRAALLEADAGDVKQAVRDFTDLAGPGDPFHASAREQLAILALAQKNDAEAGRWLDMIVSDPTAPAPVRQRAESFEGLVAGSGFFTPKAAHPSAPAAPSGASGAASKTAPAPAPAKPSAPSSSPSPAGRGSAAVKAPGAP